MLSELNIPFYSYFIQQFSKGWKRNRQIKPSRFDSAFLWRRWWAFSRGLSNSNGLRLLIFLQPLGRALKNQNAAPTTPPCFSRWLRSSSLLFKSSYPQLLLKGNCHVKQKRQWTVCLPVDIPMGWEPRAKQSRTVTLLTALRAAALFKSSFAPKKKNQYTMCTGFSWCE